MSEEPKRKIIIDEDWKSQVEAEREELKKKTESDSGSDADSRTATEPGSGGSNPPIPPASFPFLITSIATQAMIYLGQIPDPVNNESIVNLDVAKHHIDTLSILEEKTKGNLNEEEAGMLEATLHQLRMAFVAAQGSTA